MGIGNHWNRWVIACAIALLAACSEPGLIVMPSTADTASGAPDSELADTTDVQATVDAPSDAPDESTIDLPDAAATADTSVAPEPDGNQFHDVQPDAAVDALKADTALADTPAADALPTDAITDAITDSTIPDVPSDSADPADSTAAPDVPVNPALGPPYPIILAHGFFGFNDFAGVGFITYFYQVKDQLQKNGEYLVFTPTVDPFASSEVRGEQLWPQVEAILQQTGKAKVVLVGHSQGGLDARVIAHNHPDKVAAVMMVATPHQGSPVSDVVLFLTPGPISKGVVDALGALLGGTINPDGSTSDGSMMAALTQLSSKTMPGFNAKYTDAPGVPYWSVAGRSTYAGNGGECSVSNSPDFVKKWAKELDPCNALLFGLTAAMIGQVNDGLVPVTSAKYGTFLGCIPADHLDQIGQILGQPPGLFNSFDHKEFWVGVVGYLRGLGY